MNPGDEGYQELLEMVEHGADTFLVFDYVDGKAVQASDIFSLGVCLYEMLTGRLPYEGSDLLAQKERRAYAPPRQTAPELPANADILIAAALEPDPAKRIADAAELALFLEDLK